MKRSIVLICLFIVSVVCAQKKITVYALETKQPVKYANIWREKALFVTADSTGSFVLSNTDLNRDFKITAIGFKDTITRINGDVFLRLQTIALEEVKVIKHKNEKILKLGKAEKGDNHYAVQYDATIAQTAKYFSNSKSGTNYLSKVRFFATTTAKNRLVSLLFFTVNENGQPGELINTENVMCPLKKGTHKVEVDVSQWNMEFPKEGVFVCIQHPLLEQNKNYLDKENNPRGFFYEPLISINHINEYKDSWYFKDEKWNKNEGYSINMELILTD